MDKKILSIALVLMTISLLFSCNESEIGIFYGLSHEKKVKNYALPDHCTSESMIKTGGYLYVASSSIYKKQAAGGELDWHKIKSPDGYHNVTEMGLANDTIFVLAYDSDDAKPFLFSGTGDGTWEKKDTSAIEKTISRMRVANNTIFITDREGHLFYSNDDGASFTQDTSLDDSKLFSTSTGNFDLIYGGGSYYLNAQYKLYRGNPGGWTEFTPYHDGKIWKDKDDVFTRLYYDEEDDRLYTADNSGYIYAVDSPSGASGSSWQKSDKHARSGMGLQGLVVVRVPTSSGSSRKLLMAGTGINSGRGYYIVDNPRTSERKYLDPEPPRNRDYTTVISDYYDYNAFNISKAAINAFFVDDYGDGSNFDLYAMTYGYGVWKNTNKGNYVRGWNQE